MSIVNLHEEEEDPVVAFSCEVSDVVVDELLEFVAIEEPLPEALIDQLTEMHLEVRRRVREFVHSFDSMIHQEN